MIQEAFVINLEERTDRLTDFYSQSLPFPVKRFPAYKETHGGYGCVKSHVGLLRIPHKLPFIVFEDDALLVQDWSIVEMAMEQLPDNWDVLFLGATLLKPIRRYSKNLFYLHSAWCTQAIIYGSTRVMEDICTNALSSGKAIDVFFRYHIFPKYNCFITDPLVAVQKGYISDITGRMSAVSNIVLANFEKFTSHAR